MEELDIQIRLLLEKKLGKKICGCIQNVRTYGYGMITPR
jgi:hypothetical protein